MTVADPRHFVYRQIMNAESGADAAVSRLAIAIGEPARTRMLLSLMDGRARTSTELAMLADVTPSTASVHLNRLKKEKLVRVSVQGRHRYYCLEGRSVARVLEGLSILAGGNGKGFVPSTPEPLRKARTCYDHIAGAFAVALHDHFVQENWLISSPRESSNTYEVTMEGERRLTLLGIDVTEVRTLRRRFAYGCLDWSERRPHIAGALGAALLKHALTRRWVARDLDSRALTITRLGEREVFARLGLRL
jgi:DNA-binding transcriptional ArsR family regulator